MALSKFNEAHYKKLFDKMYGKGMFNKMINLSQTAGAAEANAGLYKDEYMRNLSDQRAAEEAAKYANVEGGILGAYGGGGGFDFGGSGGSDYTFDAPPQTIKNLMKPNTTNNYKPKVGSKRYYDKMANLFMPGK